MYVNRWDAVGDLATCSVCRSLDGKLDGDGWDSTLAPGTHEASAFGAVFGPPPAHPGCRCWTTLVEVTPSAMSSSSWGGSSGSPSSGRSSSGQW